MILHTEQCLKSLHQKSSCKKCVDACPSHAIQLISKRLPTLDSLKCLQCGACITVCPTEAFENQMLLDETLIKAIDQKCTSNEKIIFSCKNIKTSNDSIKLPCLAQMDKSLWLYAILISRQDIYIEHGICDQCSFSCTQSVISKTLDHVNQLCLLANWPFIFHREQKKANGDLKKEKKDASERRGQIRRRFLLALLGKTSYPQQECVPTNVTISNTQNHYAKHERYLAMLNILFGSQNISSLSPFGTRPTIDENACQQCSICTRVCPTGALRLSSQESHSGIVFTARLCIECHLCSDICFTHAISFEHKFLHDLFHNTQAIITREYFQKNPKKTLHTVPVYTT